MAKVNYKFAFLCFVCSVFLMVICFYNGYPLYGGDTQAYLYSAFNEWVPPDRPPFYGEFIRFTSLRTSLWFTIFFQCLLVSYVLVRYIKMLNQGRASFRFTIVAVITVTAFTCVSWICAYLIPDIFTGILLLATLLYLFDDSASKLTRIFYVVIISVSVFVHNSHFLLICMFSVFTLGYALVKKYRAWIKKSLLMLSIGIFFYFLMCFVNKHSYQQFTFSPSSKVFIVAKLAANGILDTYLADNCGKKQLRICAVKGQLPSTTYDFMWPGPSTALSKIGPWDSYGPEFKGIIYDILTTPKYLNMYMQRAVTSTAQQMCSVEVEKPFAFPKDNWKIAKLKDYFEDEYKELSSSAQNGNSLDTAMFNFVYILFFVVSFLLVLALYPHLAHKELIPLYVCILAFFVINAFTTSNFSMVAPRFQNRIFWIFPATNTVLILRYLRDKYKSPVLFLV